MGLFLDFHQYEKQIVKLEFGGVVSGRGNNAAKINLFFIHLSLRASLVIIVSNFRALYK